MSRQFLEKNYSKSLFIAPTTEEEIQNVALSMRNKTSSDCYNINMKTAINALMSL